MSIVVTGMNGQPVGEAVHERLHSILSRLNTSAKQIQSGIVESVRSNF